MHLSVIRHGVRCYHNGGVRLVDGVGDRRAGDAVVVGVSCEAPGIAGVCSGVRMGRIERYCTDGRTRFTVHTSDRGDGCRVDLSVVGHGVRCYDDCGCCLVDSQRAIDVGDGIVAGLVVWIAQR